MDALGASAYDLSCSSRRVCLSVYVCMCFAATQGELSIRLYTYRLLKSKDHVFLSNFTNLNHFGWPLEVFKAALELGLSCTSDIPDERLTLHAARSRLIEILRLGEDK